ncbi:MAG TPA: adenylate/guanylate cyclase domain-containing protein [Aggregatilineales bacterium]|nr:adenylate/guanylate cyclase domain-containing protein [Aggregatilineales bacterium]HQA67529.1 adenylate/guanylate cyclase domain-containing protein [Aggregatilineales bacterium]HQE17691.1 adenylate/guanylate cyclase domain-containing protein [Aggregatilineales bacterium]
MTIETTGTRHAELSAELDAIHQLAVDLRTVLDKQRELLRAQGMRLPTGSRGALTALSHRLRIVRQHAEALQQERDEYRALADIAALMNSSLDLTDVLSQVMDTIIKLTGAERGYMMLRDEVTGELVPRIARNLDQQTLDSSEFEVSRSVVKRVSETGKPILTTNAQEDRRFQDAESVVGYHLRSILCVPLVVRGDLIGVIYADNKIQEGLFTEHTRDLLVAFANQAAVSIENARLFQQIRESLEAITEMKSLQDNIFASIASGVITTDLSGRVTYMNRRAQQILGIEAEDLFEHGLSYLVSALGQRFEVLLNMVQRYGQRLTGIEFELEYEGQECRHLSMNFSPLKDAYNQTQGVAIVLDDLTETRRREAQIAGVRRYLPHEVVDGIRSPDELKLGGTRQVITILFADVRGFSLISERMGPEKLVEILNRHLTIASDAIHEQQGVIDKFMGDAVMALYNTPLRPQADHALRAVRSAATLLADLYSYHRIVPPDERLRFGIGIHTGEAVVGNVGSPERLNYTAVGDAVNLAKRLQEIAKPNQIILSHETCQALGGQAEVRELAPLQLPGRSQPIRIYELLRVR